MISKSLTRRLERLEDEICPGEPEIVVLHIVGVGPEGKRTDGPTFRVETPPRPVKRRPR